VTWTLTFKNGIFMSILPCYTAQSNTSLSVGLSVCKKTMPAIIISSATYTWWIRSHSSGAVTCAHCHSNSFISLSSILARKMGVSVVAVVIIAVH